MAHDPDDPTRPLTPSRSGAGSPPADAEEYAWRDEVLDRIGTLRALLAVAGVIAVAGLGVGLWALLSLDGEDSGGGASRERVSELEDRVDDLESAADSAPSRSDLSELREDQRALEDKVDAVEKTAQSSQQAVDELDQDVQDLQRQIDELETSVEDVSQQPSPSPSP
jgi:tetrahydromethanopterin S-methyltransferase subunit B